MRSSDWSSDVCSSDLAARQIGRSRAGGQSAGVKGALSPSLAGARGGSTKRPAQCRQFFALTQKGSLRSLPTPDRKSVVSGKRVSVRVDLGGRRIIKKITKLDQA